MTIQMSASMIAGLVIAFTASWRLSLLILATTPLLILFGAAEMKVGVAKVEVTFARSVSVVAVAAGWSAC